MLSAGKLLLGDAHVHTLGANDLIAEQLHDATSSKSVLTSIVSPYAGAEHAQVPACTGAGLHETIAFKLDTDIHRTANSQSSQTRGWCAGNAYSFNTTMPRMLRSLSSVGQDLTRHTIITGMGALTQRMCTIVMRNGGHLGHCAIEERIGGPDGPVDWGTSW